MVLGAYCNLVAGVGNRGVGVHRGGMDVVTAVPIVCLTGSMMAEETEADNAGSPGTRALVGLSSGLGRIAGH